jgi:hypothetical protein
MSTLLEQASLVLIPSGYKEDVVYSQIPTDGSGDLSFTRASNGTRINSAGLVEVCPWNEAQQSNTFGTSPWSNTLDTGATLTYTANYGTAPDGTTTAGRLQMALNGSNYAQKNQIISVITGQQYTYSVYMRSLSGTKNIIFCYDNTNNISATVTTEWQRFTATFTGNSQVYARFVLEAGTSTSVDLLIYGAQLNIGSTAKPYFPTTDRLNVPRLTYQNGGGGCPSLLLEKQSTNIMLYSEDFTNVAYLLSSASVSANTTISPDGTQNADSVTYSGGGVIEQLILYSAGNLTHTISVWAKVASGTKTFNLKLTHAGVVNYFSPDFTATTTWQRFTFTQAFGSGGIGFYAGVQSTDSTIQLWGLQLEPNTSYVTSYIPSFGASATRVADACFKTGISSLIGQTEGTIFVDIVTPTNIPSGAEILPISIFPSGGGTGGIQAYIAFLSNGTVRFVYYDGSSIQALITTASSFWSAGNRYKLAAVYKQNDFAFYINGVQIGTDNSGNVSAMADFYLDYQGLVQQNTVNQAALFKTRLTNAELASLTTI